MSLKTSKDLLFFELFQNKAITYSTIDSLLKYGFDSNESLLSLDFDLDFPQMPDICLSQKCILRQLLTDFRKNYNKFSDNWNQDNESEESLRENKEFVFKSNKIFIESESIVRQIKERLLRQNQSSSNPKNDNNFNKIFDISFDPIVDQLRESLIKVEKQKQEKDVILQKQKIELKVKDMSIQKLQNEIKCLEKQLISEKMKVEKLEYKLKSKKSQSICNQNLENQFNENINSLDKLRDIYYNSVENNDSDCDQQSSETEDQSPLKNSNPPKIDNPLENTNFVNYWTEVDNNSMQNLDQLKTCLFTEFVSKHSTGGSESAESAVCIDLDSNDDSTSSPSLNQSVNQQNRSIEQKSSEEEDMSESETVPFNSSEVETIVCEPDINTSAVKTGFKPKVHLKVENNRIVVNTSEPKLTFRTKTPIKAQKPQLRVQHNTQSSPLRQYQCDYQNCTFSFVSSEGLKRHIRSVHTKEKPFKCDFEGCHKCFGRSDALKEHMKRHLGLKLFKCSYSECDFESVSSNSLKRHILSIHLKEKHFKCLYENCDKTFGRKDSLKKHMEKQHQICDTL